LLQQLFPQEGKAMLQNTASVCFFLQSTPDFLQGFSHSTETAVMITSMGRKDFFQRGATDSGPFLGGNSGEISFYPLETKRATFFCENFNRKISNFKIHGVLAHLCTTFPSPMVTRSWASYLSMDQPNFC